MRASTSFARTCSGDMYATVPSIMPGLVRCLSDSSWPAATLAVTFARPKSRIFACPRRVDEDVGRLDVAMHDAFAVRRVEPVGNVNGNAEQFFGFERPVQDSVLQGCAVEELHRP